MNILKDASWLTSARIRLWGLCFLVLWAVFAGLDVYQHTRAGITNEAGEPAGHDFINYRAGAQLARHGHAETAYDVSGFQEFENDLAGRETTPRMYSYPPVAMLLTLPLAFLPFGVALLAWHAAGIGVCAWLAAKLSGDKRIGWLVAFGAPAAFFNVMAGQNGHFTAALLAGGLMLLDRKPVIAGLLLGLLCYKPQLGLLLPLALLAGGYWRGFFSASATVILLCAASYFAFGIETWRGFFAQMEVQRQVMEQAGAMWVRFPTVFAAFMTAGAGTMIAYAAQILSALAAAFMVVKVWRSKVSLNVKAAVLMSGIFLAIPYAWDYDMAVLSFAALLLAREGNWQPWEKTAWLGVICLPLLMPALAAAHIHIGAAVLWTALLVTAKRVKDFQ